MHSSMANVIGQLQSASLAMQYNSFPYIILTVLIAGQCIMHTYQPSRFYRDYPAKRALILSTKLPLITCTHNARLTGTVASHSHAFRNSAVGRNVVYIDSRLIRFSYARRRKVWLRVYNSECFKTNEQMNLLHRI